MVGLIAVIAKEEIPEDEKGTTMRARRHEEEPRDEASKKHGKRNKAPMTMRPQAEQEDDNTLCITARVTKMAKKSGLSVNKFLKVAEKAVKKSKKAKGKTCGEEIFSKSAKKIAEYFSKKSICPGGKKQAIHKLKYYLLKEGKGISSAKTKRVRNAISILEKED